MAHLVANIPPVHCYIRKEFLYDFEKGHGEYEPCIWVSIKSIRGKAFLRNLSCKFYAKDKKFHEGNYMFTVDHSAPDLNVIDTSYAEWPEDHKSFNFIELNNGQYAAQPNNRCLFLDAASNPKELKFPDFKVCTKKYVVEQNPKWFLGDTNTVMYEEDKL